MEVVLYFWIRSLEKTNVIWQVAQANPSFPLARTGKRPLSGRSRKSYVFPPIKMNHPAATISFIPLQGRH